MGHVAFLLGQDYADVEFDQPFQELRELGYACTIVGVEKGASLAGKRGQSRATTDEASLGQQAKAFDALVIPGGASPAHLRKDPDCVRLTREMVESGRPVAAICHGPELLAEADVLRGRRVTSGASVGHEMRAAGAEWVDDQVVVDDNLITARGPDDLPAFLVALKQALPAAGGGA